MATLTKTKKVDTLNPPRDIRENTKARRAWLAAEVERVNALPRMSAKIVGTGSYQSVSVYETIESEGRERTRGVCQCCGNAQVVDDRGRLVLHGYKRPGWGSTVGECPGRGELPLNVSKVLTEQWHTEYTTSHIAAAAQYEAAKLAVRAARAAMHANTTEDRYTAMQAKPRKPDSMRMRSWPSADVVAALATYRAAKADWSVRYPLNAAYEAALVNESETRNAEWQHRQARDHFATLLARGVHGTPLTVEVVA